MRKTLLSMLMLLVPLSLLAAPNVWISKPRQDLGAVRQGEVARAGFTITNRGDEPLALKPEACCGLSVSAPEGLSIRPGASARIELSYETAYALGDFTKQALIATNDPRRPQVALAITGRILAEIELSPSLIDFGQVKAGTVTRQQLTITNHAKRKLSLSGLQLKPQRQLRLAGELPASLAPGQSVSLTLVFTAPRYKGSVWGALKFATDLNYLPTRTVPIRAVVR